MRRVVRVRVRRPRCGCGAGGMEMCDLSWSVLSEVPCPWRPVSGGGRPAPTGVLAGGGPSERVVRVVVGHGVSFVWRSAKPVAVALIRCGGAGLEQSRSSAAAAA